MDMFHSIKRLFLRQKPTLKTVPKHVAIIMDGNGRWAQQRGMPRTAGHRAGLERLKEAVFTCIDYGVSYLTVYAFSTENWKRPQEEVGFLMKLFYEALSTEVDKLYSQGIKIRFIGLKHNLGPDLLALMEESERRSPDNIRLLVNIALNYGGRSEILSAVKGIACAVQNNELQADELTEADIASRLFTANQPDPDLMIRTSGEARISNFLIWQLAYTELYFTQKYWPDFRKNDLIEAFIYYSQRERRFGGIKKGDFN